MPATFRKTIDKTLQYVTTKFAFLDDILVVSKGNLQEHENELDKILKKLNDENLAINLQKCEFANGEIVWLGFKLTPNGVTPTKPKCEAILKLEEPKTLKQLRSFMGCIHHLIKFLPNIAHISEPLRPLLSKANTKSQNKLAWNDTHTEVFNKKKLKFKALPKTNILTQTNKHESIATQAKKDSEPV